MAFEIKDLAGLSQPATKLIELVSAAVGTLYRPRAIQSDAAAKAVEPEPRMTISWLWDILKPSSSQSTCKNGN